MKDEFGEIRRKLSLKPMMMKDEKIQGKKNNLQKTPKLAPRPTSICM